MNSTNGATFDWKGKGWLFFVSSHWEVLGYGREDSSNLEWAVTCTSFSPLPYLFSQQHAKRPEELMIDFSKTLFTPSGIDIYIRSSPSGGSTPTTEQRQELLEKVIVAVQGCKVGGVGELAKKGFQVPGVV